MIITDLIILTNDIKKIKELTEIRIKYTNNKYLGILGFLNDIHYFIR